jgi:transcription initiation factor TFIIIB Brf1 subunit/transcription initiation factor TFIIB
MAERRKSMHARKRKTTRKPERKATPKRWSQRVTRESDALDLDHGVFKQTSAKKIAASLKRSAERSSRRKTGAYRSALSMLIFYINRAGKNLPKTQRTRLERAKVELKHQFGRE